MSPRHLIGQGGLGMLISQTLLRMSHHSNGIRGHCRTARPHSSGATTGNGQCRAVRFPAQNSRCAAMVGGALKIQSSVGGGTTVLLSVPPERAAPVRIVESCEWSYSLRALSNAEGASRPASLMRWTKLESVCRAENVRTWITDISRKAASTTGDRCACRYTL